MPPRVTRTRWDFMRASLRVSVAWKLGGTALFCDATLSWWPGTPPAHVQRARRPCDPKAEVTGSPSAAVKLKHPFFGCLRRASWPRLVSGRLLIEWLGI